MAVLRRYRARVLDLPGGENVGREEFSQAPHAVGFRTRRQQHLAEVEIRNQLRQLKAELRIG